MNLYLLGILVFVVAATLDFAHANYVRAVQLRRPYWAALWSVCQWAAGTTAFVIAVKVSLWLLPLEAAGLALGTILGVKRTCGTSEPGPEFR